MEPIVVLPDNGVQHGRLPRAAYGGERKQGAFWLRPCKFEGQFLFGLPIRRPVGQRIGTVVLREG